MSAKSDNFFLFKNKKNKKLPWPASPKSDLKSFDLDFTRPKKASFLFFIFSL